MICAIFRQAYNLLALSYHRNIQRISSAWRKFDPKQRYLNSSSQLSNLKSVHQWRLFTPSTLLTSASLGDKVLIETNYDSFVGMIYRARKKGAAMLEVTKEAKHKLRARLAFCWSVISVCHIPYGTNNKSGT